MADRTSETSVRRPTLFNHLPFHPGSRWARTNQRKQNQAVRIQERGVGFRQLLRRVVCVESGCTCYEGLGGPVRDAAVKPARSRLRPS